MNNPVTPARWHCKGLCKSLVLFYMFHVNNKKKKKKKDPLVHISDKFYMEFTSFILENAFVYVISKILGKLLGPQCV